MIDYVICDHKRTLMDVGVVTKVDMGSVQLNEKRKALKPFRQKSKRNQIEYTELNKTIRKMRRKRRENTGPGWSMRCWKGSKIINRKLEGGRTFLSSSHQQSKNHGHD